MNDIVLDIKDVKIELSKRFFWEYLKIKDPDFFKESRPHLKDFANILQDFVEGKLVNDHGKNPSILIINMPPRVGKSYTLTNFCAWVLGKSRVHPDFWRIKKKAQVITVSYNSRMADEFSKFCRDIISETTLDPHQITYHDIFKVGLKKGSAAKGMWAMEDDYFSYLGAGFDGTLTGKGATLGIIDDPIKNMAEAYNINTLDKIWDFYRLTYRSRLESGAYQIVNHTRWRDEDLAGRIEKHFPEKCFVYSRSIVENCTYEHNEEGHEIVSGGDLLCEELCNWEDFYDLQEVITREIFLANYFQTPFDTEGRMYQSFNTYSKDTLEELYKSNCGRLPGRTCARTDTADEGKDFLVNIIFQEIDGQAWILDVYYTQDPMEVTEVETASRLYEYKVNLCTIESNNGGRGFARAVEKELKKKNYNETVITWFHESNNKLARIFSSSAWVQKNIMFPEDWSKRWPRFFDDVSKYMKEAKSTDRDDGPDCLTGVAEHFLEELPMIAFI